MSHASYTFRSEWTVDAPAEDLYDVLEDVAGYPKWWPQVRAVARLDEGTALVACRSLLPYTLHVELSPELRDRDAGVLEASLGGDLVGRSRWTLTPGAAGTRMVYDQQVHAPSAAMRGLTRLARPALEANHGWMMRGALRGLGGRTAR